VTAQLTTHNAQITTATVEVKTLTISGKQVTLAVFRQLREEKLIDEAGNLNGTPWGSVNYCPPKCQGGIHLHVVWQRGEELLRATVRPLYYGAGFYSEGADAYVQAAFCANSHRLPDGMSRRRDPDDSTEWCIGFEMDRIQCITAGEPKWASNHECNLDLDQERNWVAADVAAEIVRRGRVRARWDVLNDRQQTPQLFIAV
jgi:hypothetical protein